MAKSFVPSCLRLVPVIAVSLACAVSAQAATVNWLPTSGTNDYNTATNWSGSAVPTSLDDASFPASVNGTQTVTLAVSPSSQPKNVTVGTTSGTLTFDSTRSAAGFTVLQAASNIVIGTGSGANVVVQKSGTSGFVFRSASSFLVGGTGGSNTTVTATGTGVTLGSANSIIIVGFDNSSNNLLQATNGAALSSLGGTIGRTNNSDNNTVKVSGTGSSWTLANNPASGNLSVGILAGNDNNSLIVEDGGRVNSNLEFRIYRGKLALDGGIVDLTYDSGTFTTDQAIKLEAAGRVEGQGSIKASELSSTQVGATVEVGTGGFGTLAAEFTGAGWINSNVKIEMTLGNLTGSPVAGTNYDFLDIAGNFTYGGNLEIDLASATMPVGAFDILLVGWTGTVGSSGDLSVSFINGSALDYYYAADGLHLIPEPSTLGLLALGLLSVTLRRSRRRA